MDELNAPQYPQVINCLLDSFKEKKGDLLQDSAAQVIFSTLLEIRESARRNRAYEVMDFITDELANLGLKLEEGISVRLVRIESDQ